MEKYAARRKETTQMRVRRKSTDTDNATLTGSQFVSIYNNELISLVVNLIYCTLASTFIQSYLTLPREYVFLPHLALI